MREEARKNTIYRMICQGLRPWMQVCPETGPQAPDPGTGKASLYGGARRRLVMMIALMLLMCLPLGARADVLVDNGGPGTSFTGQWPVSGGNDHYGSDSQWSRDGNTYTWALGSQPAGVYEIFMWWSSWPSRASSVPVQVRHADGVSTFSINQRQNAGRWNSLGTYFLDSSSQVTIVAANGSTVSTCADAVLFEYIGGNSPPSASIDSITPNPAQPGQAVTFTGHGTDNEGAIVEWLWESDLDGELCDSASCTVSSLSQGTHTISFFVRDEEGLWSEPASADLVVGGEEPGEVIIDNNSSSASFTGPWPVSGGSGSYGPDSQWSRDGNTFTWTFTPVVSAYYELSMWWTEWPSRSTSVPVRIEHYDGGPTSTTFTINQQQGGSRWNSLGVYFFDASRSYRVTITASYGSTVSTCADAVRFVPVDEPGNSPPAAAFTADKTTGGVPCTVRFYDQSTGEVDSRLWDFGDGFTSTLKDPVHQYNRAGVFRVSLTVSNAYGSDTMVRDAYIRVYEAAERIYLIDSYSKNALFLPRCYEYLKRLGATEQGGVWVYTNPVKGVTYHIYTVNTPEGMELALKDEGSHIVFNGHSNFGFGATFANSREIQNQRIDNIYFVDDDRFTNYSSEMVSVKIDGMKYGQAYPNWDPVFKNGASAVMPYTFSEGTPPYNYYLTYTIPDDPVTYRVELSDGTYLERFPDSNTPAWYSADGSPPDPVKNREYFITNSDPDFNRCDFIGTWPIGMIHKGGYMGESGYLGYNYQYHSAGTGQNKAVFTIYLRYAGNYNVMASWYPSSTNATNTKFIIHHAGGPTTVEVNQRETLPSLVKSLGTFYFDAGTAKVEITDEANGRVIADAIVFNCMDNPTLLQAEFDADVRSGGAPLAVQFTDRSMSYNTQIWDIFGEGSSIRTRTWNFGDGSTSTEKNPRHVYEEPGVYTVSLTITDIMGNQHTETKEVFIATGVTAPLHAEFFARKRNDAQRTIVHFQDRSTGNITSWNWDFGDGTTSTEQNPTHTYTDIGFFTVHLTVSGPNGQDTETEQNYICNMVAIEFVDNTFHERPHFYSGSFIKFGKVICNTGTVKIPTEEMRYSRMFYGGCNSSNYYVGAFKRGIFFFAHMDTNEILAPEYLRRYLLGDTDDQILARLNAIEPAYEYYDFNQKPPSMR